MKITDVRAHPISLPLTEPLWTAQEALKDAAVLLVEVETDEGVTGYGQIHGSPLKTIAEWVTKLGEQIRGHDALAHEVIWSKLFSLTVPRPGAMYGKGTMAPVPRSARANVMAAIGGIDIALWDVKGKAARLPVYSLIGGAPRPIFTYATGGYYTPDATHDTAARELAGFVEQGYRAVKLKTGAYGVDDEIKRVAAVRKAIGNDALLMLDMNAAYGLNECIRFARGVEPYDILWLEEPLHWYLQPRDYVALAKETRIPLSHGEREIHRFTVRDFIECGAIRYLQFDGTRAAGFSEGLRVAQLAEQHGVFVVPHSAPEIHAHLVAALPEIGYCVESHPNPARDPLSHALFPQRLAFRDGYIHMNDAPGFGVEIDWKVAERYRLA